MESRVGTEGLVEVAEKPGRDEIQTALLCQVKGIRVLFDANNKKSRFKPA